MNMNKCRGDSRALSTEMASGIPGSFPSFVSFPSRFPRESCRAGYFPRLLFADALARDLMKNKSPSLAETLARNSP